MLGVIAAAVLAVAVPMSPQTRVVDQSGTLSPDGLARAQRAVADARKSTGAKFGVLVLDVLDEPAQAVAKRAIAQWAMGPNSVLLLVSRQPGTIFVQPGTALGDTLTPEKCAQIAHALVPAAKRGDFDAVVIDGLAGIADAVPRPGGCGGGPLALLLFVGAGITALVVLLRARARQDQQSDHELGGSVPVYPTIRRPPHRAPERPAATRSYSRPAPDEDPAPVALVAAYAFAGGSSATSPTTYQAPTASWDDAERRDSQPSGGGASYSSDTSAPEAPTGGGASYEVNGGGASFDPPTGGGATF